VKLVKDPFGNEIFIQQTILDFNKHIIQSEEILDDISKVIEKPIMLFRMTEGNINLYYLRAIGWNKTMLLGVQKNNTHFEVVDYEIDPDIERINELHVKGQRLL